MKNGYIIPAGLLFSLAQMVQLNNCVPAKRAVVPLCCNILAITNQTLNAEYSPDSSMNVSYLSFYPSVSKEDESLHIVTLNRKPVL